jgi:hypothetical protein
LAAQRWWIAPNEPGLLCLHIGFRRRMKWPNEPSGTYFLVSAGTEQTQ